jgi:hypothetical protein
VLYQASDLSVLPTAVTATETQTPRTTDGTDGVSATTSAQATASGSVSGSSDRHVLSSGAIAGIAVGAAAVVLLLVAVAWYVWRLRRQLSTTKEGGGDGDGARELHGEDSKRHELLTEEKPAEAVGSDAAAEMPITGWAKNGIVQPHMDPAEMQG